MIKLEINDKKYNIPTSFEELKLEQYCSAFFNLPKTSEDMDELEMFEVLKKNESIILSRLLGEDDDFCMDLPLNVYALVNEKVKFIYDSEAFTKNHKSSIKIDGKVYSIPPLNEMSLRQYIDADMVLKAEENPLQYVELLSVLLTAKDDNGKWIPYDGSYQEMMERVKNLSCSDALPLVYHFFLKSHTSKKLSRVSMKVEALNRQLHNIQNS